MTEVEAGRHPPRKTKSAVFSVRFPGDELWEVRRAAQAADVSVGEFIRQAALARARSSAVPAAFAGAVGRALSDIYHDYTTTQAPPGESLEDLVNWLGSETRSASQSQPPQDRDVD
jgi:hypothetical protein